MFNTLQNSVEIRCTLKPDGPVLVRAQSVGLDPVAADMEFHRTRVDGRPTVFLAGSGLKGVLRAHAERLLRSAGRFACDPTKVKEPKTCGHFRRHLGPPTRDYPHANQCSACFTFGSLKLAGRFRLDDAFPSGEHWEAANQTEVRTGVGIDRKTQAASGGVLYDTEVVVGGAFDARIRGENFSLWQLGLVLASLDHLAMGLVRIGGCKARGMGSFEVEDLEVDLRFLDRKAGRLTGVRAVGEEKYDYGLPANDELPAPHGGKETQAGLFRLVCYRSKAVQGLSEVLQAPGGALDRHLRREN